MFLPSRAGGVVTEGQFETADGYNRLDLRWYVRNELIVSLLARCPIDTQGERGQERVYRWIGLVGGCLSSIS